MASSTAVNNISATFSYSSSSSSIFTPPANTSLIKISTSWNPHSSLPPSLKHSFLSIYGRPGPPRPPTALLLPPPPPPPPSAAVIMRRLPPTIVVSYLDSGHRLRRVTLASLCRKKKAVVVWACGAFSTECSSYVKAVEEKGGSSDLIACVGTNGVDVMRAWGERMEVGEKTRMVSDVEGGLCRALGIEVWEKKRFCFTVFNGVITGFSSEDGCWVGEKKEQKVGNGFE